MMDTPNSQDDAIDGKLGRGTRLSIYWDHDSRWHCGVVDAHCPSQLYGDQVYRIKYDDGQVADANLESTKYNIVNVSLAGGRTPIDPPDGFLANDNDYQILWPETNEHTSFRPNREHITFYSYSFANQTCEVEWKHNGRVFNTTFCEASSTRTRRKPIPLALHQLHSPTKKQRCAPKPMSIAKPSNIPSSSKSPSAAENALPTLQQESTSQQPIHVKSLFGSRSMDECILGTNTTESNFITDELKMSRADVIFSMPSEMRSMLLECCWAKWNNVPQPILILSPFSINDGEIIEEWVRMYKKMANLGNLDRMQYLVYWYQCGWSESYGFKAFSLVKKESIVPFDVGIEQRWHHMFDRKINNPIEYGLLTKKEDDLLQGIKQMMDDHELPKDQRGGYVTQLSISTYLLCPF
jgi:hypothetical protein